MFYKVCTTLLFANGCVSTFVCVCNSNVPHQTICIAINVKTSLRLKYYFSFYKKFSCVRKISVLIWYNSEASDISLIFFLGLLHTHCASNSFQVLNVCVDKKCFIEEKKWSTFGSVQPNYIYALHIELYFILLINDRKDKVDNRLFFS